MCEQREEEHDGNKIFMDETLACSKMYQLFLSDLSIFTYPRLYVLNCLLELSIYIDVLSTGKSKLAMDQSRITKPCYVDPIREARGLIRLYSRRSLISHDLSRRMSRISHSNTRNSFDVLFEP